MKDRIKGLLTRKKLFRFFKIAVIVVLTTIALLSLLGTVAHASGLVDDTVNADIGTGIQPANFQESGVNFIPLDNLQIRDPVGKKQKKHGNG